MAKCKPQKTESSKLIEALKFVSLAQHEKGSALKTFCQLSNGFATSSDGILTACHTIEEDLEARPHTLKLIAALNNCGKNISITQLEGNAITIKSGKYFAKIPCHDEEIVSYGPDQAVCPINNSIIEGFKKIGHLTAETGETVYQSSILMQSGSMISTNGFIGIEFWHGIDMPTIKVPKSFVSAICKVNKNLVSMGFSASSATFWFDDESWLKTQLFPDEWPDIIQAFTMPDLKVIDVPKMFYTAIEAVQDFAVDGREKGAVYISKFGISSHKNKSDGAVYNLTGIDGELLVGIRNLKNIQNCCNQMAFGADRIFFFGDNVRGVLMCMKD
jgi:hypothetical protein